MSSTNIERYIGLLSKQSNFNNSKKITDFLKSIKFYRKNSSAN